MIGFSPVGNRFFLCVSLVVGFCLACDWSPPFQYFFHNRNAVEVGAVVREAYRLQDSTPVEVHPKRMLEPFAPLTKGQYPIFNKYPKFIVDYQVNQ